MFGCCGAERKKFKTQERVVDSERLEKLVTEKKSEGWSEANIEKLKHCKCICHTDGVVCFC